LEYENHPNYTQVLGSKEDTVVHNPLTQEEAEAFEAYMRALDDWAEKEMHKDHNEGERPEWCRLCHQEEPEA